MQLELVPVYKVAAGYEKGDIYLQRQVWFIPFVDKRMGGG